jgi:magnesium transporter
VIRVTLFAADGSARSGGEELLAAEVPADGVAWIDLEGTDPRYEPWLLERGFHPLAVEDVFTVQHQPKVEEYGETMFVIVRGLDFNVREAESGELRTLKLAAFLDRRQLVTVHRAPLRSVGIAHQRFVDSGRALPGGPAHVLWSICDEMMDLYVPVIEGIGDEIEELEERVVASPDGDQLARVLTLRRQLATLRRTMLPHRQVFNHLANSRGGPIDDTAGLNFRDIQDNVLRLADSIEQERDLLNNIKDTYLSVVAQRTNDVMRVLTVFSAIVLPLSLLAGIYGMNFERMPELGSPWGYPLVLAAMAVVAGGMLAWFRRKGWI